MNNICRLFGHDWEERPVDVSNTILTDIDGGEHRNMFDLKTTARMCKRCREMNCDDMEAIVDRLYDENGLERPCEDDDI